MVGVDIAGPRPDGGRYPYRDLAPLVEEARSGGLGVTIHVGEEGGQHGIDEIGEVIEHLRPGAHRPRHPGGGGRGDDAAPAGAEIVLEICPSSNLLTGALADEDALRDTVRTFADREVAFTIATDGPEMMQTHLGTSSPCCFGSALSARRKSRRSTTEGTRQRSSARGRGSSRLTISATPYGVRSKIARPADSRIGGALPGWPPCSASTAESGSPSGSGRSSG